MNRLGIAEATLGFIDFSKALEVLAELGMVGDMSFSECKILCVALLLACVPSMGQAARTLPFDTVFVGQAKFAQLVKQAEREKWPALPLGDRTVAVGRALVGTPYKNYTLEIDDHIEAVSVNLDALDCWTFFEVALGFSRMLAHPRQEWTPQTLLAYVELDRYRGGKCDGNYNSRLHYLEEWMMDNEKRGLVEDLTRKLGGVRVAHEAREMTVGWRGYRYMRMNPELRTSIAAMERRISAMPLYHIPKARVPAIESKLRNGDVICITSRDGKKAATSHVGLAYRDSKGVLRFMHASSLRNFGKVVVDDRLSGYLNRHGGHLGIMVGRPIK